MPLTTVKNGRTDGNPNLLFISALNAKANIPNAPSKCLWRLQQAGDEIIQSPHTKNDPILNGGSRVYSNVMETVGNTPLVRLRNIEASFRLKYNLYAKCEFFNPGGSVKDRIGFRMVSDAEQAGLLHAGSTIIEPTSGNTGIGLAIAAAVKGYRCVIVISEKMSNEKVDVLRALGAEIVRTPITAGSADENGVFNVAHKLRKSIPDSIILDQYSNPGNPLAHYDTTAEEILKQCNGHVDMVVMGAGTGGTITGVGRRFKECSPETIVVGADPMGSILAQPSSLNELVDSDFYEVEGIGYDFVPTCLDRSIVDKWIKVADKEALSLARRLIREEGLLCGGSSGAALYAALEAAKAYDSNQIVVVLLPDSIRNYITKFVADSWMEVRSLKAVPSSPPEGIGNCKWWNTPASQIGQLMPAAKTVQIEATCQQALDIMIETSVQYLAIIDDTIGALKGITSTQKLLTSCMNGQFQWDDSVQKVIIDCGYAKMDQTSGTMGLLSRILQREPFVLLTSTTKKAFNAEKIEIPVTFVTSLDFITLIGPSSRMWNTVSSTN